jgi:hypothetical protein
MSSFKDGTLTSFESEGRDGAAKVGFNDPGIKKHV